MNSIGDIQSVTADGTTTNRTTNADNQITNIGSATISYDNNGNVTTDDKGNTLVYDAWNRLVEVKNSSGDLVAGYTYDGLGRMTSETDGITTIDFYYSGQQIIEERTGVTTATGVATGSNGSVAEELVYSPDYVNDVLSRDTYVSGSYSSRVFFTHDANYDVTGVVQNSTTGTMLQRMTYDAYGNVTFLTSSWVATTDGYAVESLWQGGWRDVNTGYYHFQGRWYSPSMQWLSWDPINYPNGPSAYLPVADNPINGLDPSGEMRIIFAFEGLGNYDKNRTVKDGGTAKTINQFLIDAGIDPNPSSVPVTDDSKDDYVIYSNYNGFQNALNWITKQGLDKPYKTASGGCKYNTFVAVGHSLGGGGAWAFSHKVLEQLHFKINLGFTLDPRNAFNWSGDENDQAPWKRADWGWNTLAAESWINYYRPTGWLQGYPLPGAKNNPVTDGTSHDQLLTYGPAIADFKSAIAGIGFSQDKLPQ